MNEKQDFIARLMVKLESIADLLEKESDSIDGNSVDTDSIHENIKRLSQIQGAYGVLRELNSFIGEEISS